VQVTDTPTVYVTFFSAFGLALPRCDDDVDSSARGVEAPTFDVTDGGESGEGE
jgi:hypothetical protein